MPTPIDPKRLPGLRSALKSFSPEDWVSQKDLAALYGVVGSRFSTLIKTRFENFPAAERRGDKTNWFPAHAALESMIAHMSGNGDMKRKQAARVGAAMGRVADVRAEADSEPVLLTPSEVDRLASAELKVFNLQSKRDQVVRVEEVRQVARDVYQVVSTAFASLIHELDPNGQLPAEIRTKLQEQVRTSQLKMYKALHRHLGGSDDAGT